MDDSFIFFDSVFFNEKEYDFEEWEGDIIYESVTNMYTEYCIYVNPYRDEFYIHRYFYSIDYDLRRYYNIEPKVDEMEDTVSLEDIQKDNPCHYKAVDRSIRNYKNRQYHIKNNLYYELMEKSMHPNRINWIF